MGQFDGFITVDGNLTYQQNLSTTPFAIVVLYARSNDIKYLQPLLPGILKVLESLCVGEIVHLGLQR